MAAQFLRCLLLPVLAVFLCAAGGVHLVDRSWASEDIAGNWAIALSPNGEPVLLLQLTTTDGVLSGSGESRGAAEAGLTAGALMVLGSALFDGGAEMVLGVTASDGRLSRARLVLEGGNGPFLPGTLLTAAGALDVFWRREDDDSVASGPGAMPSCGALDALSRELRQLGTEAELGLRGIYIDAGLYNAPQSEAKCAAALVAMRARAVELRDQRRTDAETSRQCNAVRRVQARVAGELDRLGMGESGTLDAIMRDNGLPGAGSGGRWNAEGCRRALAPLERYLADLENEFDEMLDTPGVGVFARPLRVAGLSVSERLNVRGGPGTQFRVAGAIPADARGIFVIEGCTPDIGAFEWENMSATEQIATLAASWCHVDWQGLRGWVAGRFLRPE